LTAAAATATTAALAGTIRIVVVRFVVAALARRDGSGRDRRFVSTRAVEERVEEEGVVDQLASTG
jgi:hypothetical protein